MNLVYLHTHDSGRYLQPYGYQIPTPSLMKLAEGGTLFRQAYCAAPTCSPSRAAMLTGVNAHSSGMTGLAHRGFSLSDKSRHLASTLNRSGFETALCGVQHETSSNPKELGYQHILTDTEADSTNYETLDLANTRKVLDYLKAPKEKPFFLSLGFNNTHREYPKIKDAANPDYVMPPFPLPDCPETRKDFAAYIDSASVVDRCCGMVLEALEKNGLMENTVVLFTTDHGIAFPKMKCNLYDTGIGVAMILKYPGNPSAGKVIDSLVSQLDVYPTLLSLLGVEKPGWLEGHDLTPILNGERESVREEIFAEVNYHASYEPMRCIRTKRYKLIRRFDQEYPGFPFANVDDGFSKTVLLENGWQSKKPESIQLFDLLHDPVERLNLAENPDYAPVLEDLNRRLESWMAKTDDPLLKGRVPMPEGARIHQRKCLSNQESEME